MNVLICCDHSVAGKHVLDEAQKFLCQIADVHLYVFSVIDISVVSITGTYNTGEMIGILEEDAEVVNKWTKGIFTGREINFSTELGYPAEMILKKATNIQADLLILGTHGKTGLGRLLMGSVAENVLHHASCNTLLIPVKRLKNG